MTTARNRRFAAAALATAAAVITYVAVSAVANPAAPALATSEPSALPYFGEATLTPHWQPVEHRVGRFDLVDQSGARVDERDLDGVIHVASFMFTRCPSLCPTLVQRLLPVQEAARAWTDVMLVSYSVTPETDTPEALAEFGRARGIDSSRWRLLTGDAAQIARLARESYFADDRRELPGVAAGPALLHTEKVALVDKQRRVRGVYNGTQAFEIERLLEDIRGLRGVSSR
jgi:protein SCO1/2